MGLYDIKIVFCTITGPFFCLKVRIFTYEPPTGPEISVVFFNKDLILDFFNSILWKIELKCIWSFVDSLIEKCLWIQKRYYSNGLKFSCDIFNQILPYILYQIQLMQIVVMVTPKSDDISQFEKLQIKYMEDDVSIYTHMHSTNI